jgi:hypothetical protein
MYIKLFNKTESDNIHGKYYMGLHECDDNKEFTFIDSEHFSQYAQAYPNDIYFIRPVLIPRDVNIIKLYNEPYNYMILKAKKIVLGNRANLDNPYAIKEFNLKFNSAYLNQAFSNGWHEIVEWWINNCPEIKYTEWGISQACRNGHVNVLQLWKSSGSEYINGISRLGLHYASSYGHVNVLEWWKNSGLELHYDEDTMDLALTSHLDGASNVKVLDWWKNSTLSLKYSEKSMDYAAFNGNIAVLNWWKNSGLPLKHSIFALNSASSNNKVNVLEWWKNSGLPFEYTSYALDEASGRGYLDVLKWWKNSGFPLKYTVLAMNLASSRDHINVLDWWKNSGLPLKYNQWALKCSNKVLEWWDESGLDLTLLHL